MAKIPELKTTLSAIEELEYGGYPRPYLGMSAIGEECARKLWYGFHWASFKKHSAKAERIFTAGHLFEAQIISQLKAIGCEVFRVDAEGNEIELYGHPEEEQETFVGFAGHALGHPDARIRGVIEAPKTVHILEIKTMAQKYFVPLTKKGIKDANPKYYSQMQRYMEASELKRALFVAINKNTSELYIERVEYEKDFAKTLVEKEKQIILSPESPAKAFKKDFFQCNFCEHKEVCHEGEQPQKNCRTCEFCDLNFDGAWTCQKKDGKELPVGLQRKGCSKYQKGWDL